VKAQRLPQYIEKKAVSNMNKIGLLMCLLSLTLTAGCQSDSTALVIQAVKEKQAIQLQDKELSFTGRVRVVGNAPFLEMVVTSANVDVYLNVENDQSKKYLVSQQGKPVTVFGKVNVTELFTANKQYKITKVTMGVNKIGSDK
jgi:lipopolysaccharide export system protein LptA